jgi:hypothetical protein
VAVFVAAAGLLLLGRGGLVIPVLACASLIVLPASASASTVARGLGPFDTPFESRQIRMGTQSEARNRAQVAMFVRQLEQQGQYSILLGTDTSGLAAPYILASGREVLAIGGYFGAAPVPTLATVRSDISHGDVQLFLLPIRPASPDPRVRWIEANCTQVGASSPLRPIQFANYRCARAG